MVPLSEKLLYPILLLCSLFYLLEIGDCLILLCELLAYHFGRRAAGRSGYRGIIADYSHDEEEKEEGVADPKCHRVLLD